MSVHLIGVTAMGGVPLFARQQCAQSNQWSQSSQSSLMSSTHGSTQSPPTERIPFATLATLNGVNLFSRLNDCELLLASTRDSQIRWKVYKGCVVLIVIANNVGHPCDQHLRHFLDVVFDALVLMCGVNEITSQNIERLKRCLRLSYQLLDYLLDCFLSDSLSRVSLATHKLNYYLSSHSDFASSLVESSSQLAFSSFSALFVNKKLVSASKQWWTRLSASRDALLISYLVNSLSDTDLLQTKEIPVYLPDNCPTSLSRLIVSQLSTGVTLCLLCGENPKLETIESDIIVPLIDSKANREKLSKYVRNEIQLSFSVDENIIAFVVVRNDIHIISCFGQIESNLFKYLMHLIDSPEESFQSYITHKNVRFYHITKDNIQIFVLLPQRISLTESRNITSKTLNSLLRDKHIWP